MGRIAHKCLPAALGVLVAALLAGAGPAEAHTGLLGSDPAAGSTVGPGLKRITLTFSEQPERSLSEVRILDAEGEEIQGGEPQQVAGDPRALAVEVPELPRGPYTVGYRAVSAVDGHATAGAFSFGVGVPPSDPLAAVPTGEADTWWPEVVARWALIAGLIALLGAAVAGLAGFGGPPDSYLRLARGGLATAAVGLVLLAIAQRRSGGSSLSDLLSTPVGEALIGRAVAIAAAGAALLLHARAPEGRRGLLVAAALAALAAIAIHVDAGHAGASSWSAVITVSAQVAHFAAAGVWFGGLAALLLATRGRPSTEKAVAVRRFAAVALGALVVVFATGTLRAVDELSSWGELTSTGYGRAVLAKLALIAAIVAVAVRNRRRAVPAASEDLEPLRRSSRAELALAGGAIAVAALLGSLAPAVAGPAPAPAALTAEGSDDGATVRASLETTTTLPGSNRFQVELSDPDSGDPIDAERVSLRFDPLDDPGVPESTLALRAGGEGSYAGSGENLSFDGRWEVTVVVESGEGTVEVPLGLEVPTVLGEGSLSVVRLPGRPPEYTLQIGDDGYIRIEVDPERAGPNEVAIEIFDVFQNFASTRELVLTAQAGDGPVSQRPARRLTASRFAAGVELDPGANTLAVVARREDGVRLRGVFELEVEGE